MTWGIFDVQGRKTTRYWKPYLMLAGSNQGRQHVRRPCYFSDIFPTLCELTAAKLPEQTLHGRSFAPQLLGGPGHPREWIHIQNADNRQVRNSDYMLDNQNQLRRVVELWQEPAKPNEIKEPEKETAARKTLQAVFEALGK